VTHLFHGMKFGGCQMNRGLAIRGSHGLSAQEIGGSLRPFVARFAIMSPNQRISLRGIAKVEPVILSLNCED
jgi:hypothetical protein